MLPYTETGDKHYGVSMENYQRCCQKGTTAFLRLRSALPAGRDGEPVEPLADVSYLEMVPLRLPQNVTRLVHILLNNF